MPEITTLADLTPDRHNARRRGPRAERLIVNSLHEVGAARSIVIDETGRVLAGNGTVNAAAEAGIERVQVVDADGETIIAVRRSGLTEEQKVRLALLDNRAGDIDQSYDPTILAAMAEQGIDLNDLWDPADMEAMIAAEGDIDDSPPDDPREHWQDMPGLCSDPRACRELHVYFPVQANVEAFCALVGCKLTDKTKSIWFPGPPSE